MVKIGLDPGHGGSDPGASGHGIIEADWNLGFCRELRKRLDSWPLEPILLRTGENEDVGLLERGRRSTEAGCELVVCVHVNAARDPSWYGFLAFFMPEDVKTRKYANILMRCAPDPLHKPGWNAIAAEKDSPGNWLQRPRNVMAVHERAILAEVGYCSNEGDAAALNNSFVIDGLACAIEQAVLHFCYVRGK